MFEGREVPTIPGDVMPNDITRHLQIEVAKLVGKRGTGFVGAQPVSFQKKHIDELLLRKDYFVCEKSDGLRCLMFCILDPAGDEAVFLITRENNFYRVPEIHFPLPNDVNSCHNGTLIDGEIVISKKPDGGTELRYLMFDCLAMNGSNLVHKLLDKRLGYLDREFFHPYVELRRQHPQACLNFPLKVSMKNMQPAYRIPRVFESLSSLPHVSDGLIFTNCETPYLFGTDETLLKWKPSEENTVDFRLHLNIPVFIDEDLDERDPDRQYPNYDVKPGLELHVHNGGGNYSYFGDLTVPDDKWEELKNLNEPLDERIVECNQTKDKQWNLLRFRDDKSDSNFITVLHKVLKSIEDSVSKEDLIKISPEIERAYKQRALNRRSQHDSKSHPPPPQQPQTQTQTQPQAQSQPSVSSYPSYPPLQQAVPQKDTNGEDDHKKRSIQEEFEAVPTYDADDSEDEDNDNEPTTKKSRTQ
jgi:mRNA guanylyltransferase